MFKSYQDIFDQRACEYDAAMNSTPRARQAEFNALFKLSPLVGKQRIVDVPSGAGYLSEFVNSEHEIVHVDSSKAFTSLSSLPIIHSSVTAMPLPSEQYDRVVSLAGSHHLDCKSEFFEEVKRVLRPQGIFHFADVMHGSKEDTFLNGFVDSYNSIGHQGCFLDKQTRVELERLGFDIIRAQYERVDWHFSSTSEMVQYVKNIFGLDLASDDVIFMNIENILGFTEKNSTVIMNWGLYYIDAVRII